MQRDGIGFREKSQVSVRTFGKIFWKVDAGNGTTHFKNVKKPWSINSTKEMEKDEVCAKHLETSGNTPLRAPLNKGKGGSSKIAKGKICMP